jgi:hypothetical protein
MTTQGITLRDFTGTKLGQTVTIPDLPLLLRFITLLCHHFALLGFAVPLLSELHRTMPKRS